MGPKISFSAVAFNSNFFSIPFSAFQFRMPELGQQTSRAKGRSPGNGGVLKVCTVQSKEGAENPAQICAQWLLLRFGNLEGESVCFSHACCRFKEALQGELRAEF